LALAAKLSQDTKKNKEYFKLFFHENRMSITATTEEKKALQNMLVANIILDEKDHA